MRRAWLGPAGSLTPLVMLLGGITPISDLHGGEGGEGGEGEGEGGEPGGEGEGEGESPNTVGLLQAFGQALNPLSAGTQTLGYRFTVGGSDLTARALRLYPSVTSVYDCKLWTLAGSLIEEIAIPATADAWNEMSLPAPITLSASTSYVVSVDFSGAYYRIDNAALSTFDSRISYVEGRYIVGSHVFPNVGASGRVYGIIDVVVDE